MPSPKTLFLKLVCLFFLLSNTAFAVTLDENLTSNAPFYKLQDSLSHSEKVYLHFDKPHYTTGEIMWFKTYLVSANTNKPNAKSKIVHVELIDSKNTIIKSRVIKILDGGGEGEFYLPKRLNSGEYKVRAYTNFMRNFDDAYFFLKKIQIESIKLLVSDDSKATKKAVKNKRKNLPLSSKPDLQFFPEGGYMVLNQTSEIGFKAISDNGKSVAVSGSILDANNNKISTFQTQKFGIGSLQFTPKRNESYKASINYEGRIYTYDLPKALKKGVTMKVIERTDSYQVRLQSSLSNGVDKLILAGIQNGTVVNVAQLIGSKKIGVINVPKNTLKQGIAQFIISDKNQKPLCERLVFVQTDASETAIQVTSDKAAYKKRELVTLNLNLDSIPQANMSLAVTDVSVVNADSFGLDIRSHLLLNSELKGEIEQPSYYFEPKNNDRKQLLDLLMLTQGWRQFLWNHIDERRDKKEFNHETGIRLTGTIKDQYKEREIAAAELSLIYNNKDQMVEAKTRSLKNGKFSFGDYDFVDSTNVLIQAKSRNLKRNKETNANYFIKLAANTPPPVNFKNNYVSKQKYLDDTFKSLNIDYLTRSRVAQSNSISAFEEGFEQLDKSLNIDYLTRSEVAQLNSISAFEEDFEQLDEAIVTAERKKEKYKNRNTIYGTPTRRVDFEELPNISSSNVLAAMQGKVPGLQLSGNVNNPIEFGEGVRNYQIRISGGAITLTGGIIHPLILVNNVEVSDISSIYAFDVSHVDILTPSRAAIYGSRGAGGVLSIHTKRGSDNLEKTEKQYGIGILNFTHPGYYKARKFYEPNYKTKKPAHSKFDYRTTVYWKPAIITGNNKTKISFYTADIETTYRIDLQGISKDGVPIKSEMYIDVK